MASDLVIGAGFPYLDAVRVLTRRHEEQANRSQHFFELGDPGGKSPYRVALDELDSAIGYLKQARRELQARYLKQARRELQALAATRDKREPELDELLDGLRNVVTRIDELHANEDDDSAYTFVLWTKEGADDMVRTRLRANIKRHRLDATIYQLNFGLWAVTEVVR